MPGDIEGPAITFNEPIACDDRPLARGTGVATYARALAAAQAALAGAPLRVAAGEGRLPRWLRALRPETGARRESGRIVAPDLFRTAQVHFRLSGRVLAVRVPGRPGLVHWSYPVPLRLAGWMNLYTVHDAIPLVAPALTPIDARHHRRLLRAVADVADGLVTVSEAARAEIADVLGVEAVNCGQPVTLDAAPVPPAGLVPGGYLVAVGSVEPRKNLARLAEAHRRSGTALPLVVAGPDGWRAETVALGDAIRLPWLSRAETLGLIAGARALLMPSLAEGFGLPVAEAMALGTPVVTSHAGALAETAGGAALLVDPEDVDAIAAAIGRLADDDLRGRLRAAGLRRAEAFAPAAFAERLGALYAVRLGETGRPPDGPRSSC